MNFRVDLSAAGENFQDLESCFARNVSPKFDFQKCSNPFLGMTSVIYRYGVFDTSRDELCQLAS